MEFKVINIVIVLFPLISRVATRLTLNPEDLRRPFDQDLYNNVLDPELCRMQVRNISTGNPMLLLRFLDAGIRTPRGVLKTNYVDLGNYHQCLEIDEPLGQDMRVEGKYCLIQVPVDQDLHWPELPESSKWFNPFDLMMSDETQKKVAFSNAAMSYIRAAAGFEDIRSGPIEVPSWINFRLAVCIPKPCSTEEALASMLFNVSSVGFRFQEQFCRLPNDKPWMPVDTVAVVVFSLIALLILLSTCYDLRHILILKKDPKTASALLTSFSLYTNTQRLFTFKPSKDALECLDGIRVLAMLWVIVGHTAIMYPNFYNPDDRFAWVQTPQALWITTAPLTVDTFLTIAGVLLVYTNVGKMNGWQLLKRLHLFYLHRLLRMFPALAAIVLLEASAFHRLADGPLWSTVARNAQRCRTFWWTTLLYVQNWTNPQAMCIAHSWYIAIDIQLYFVSPVVLFWVLNGNKKSAWTALIVGLLAVLAASTTYVFHKELPGSTISFARLAELADFMKYYYMNTLTRGGPFFVGMIFGYILHLCRGKRATIHLALVIALWTVAFCLFASAFYTTYLLVQLDWDNQTVDSLINSFQRSAWGVALGLMIFACVHGYGGLINWFLSLQLWKLPSRVSYGMYLYHYSQMFIASGMQLSPNYFSMPNLLFDSLGHFALTFIIALVVAVVIEAPFATLFKLMLETGKDSKPAIQNGDAKKRSA